MINRMSTTFELPALPRDLAGGNYNGRVTDVRYPDGRPLTESDVLAQKKNPELNFRVTGVTPAGKTIPGILTSNGEFAPEYQPKGLDPTSTHLLHIGTLLKGSTERLDVAAMLFGKPYVDDDGNYRNVGLDRLARIALNAFCAKHKIIADRIGGRWIILKGHRFAFIPDVGENLVMNAAEAVYLALPVGLSDEDRKTVWEFYRKQFADYIAQEVPNVQARKAMAKAATEAKTALEQALALANANNKGKAKAKAPPPYPTVRLREDFMTTGFL